MSRRALLQEGGKGWENGTNDVGIDLRETTHYRLTRRSRDFGVDSYVQGRIYVHVHIAIWIDGMDPTDITYWCVGLYRPAKDANESRADAADVLGPSGICAPRHAPLISSGDRGCRVQQAVLTDAVEYVENPERIRAVVLPSVVRLQPLDDCLRIWMPTANFEQAASGGRFASLPSLAEQGATDAGFTLPVFVPDDGEFRAVRKILRERAAMGEGERIRKDIEGRPEIVQRISDEEAERVQRWAFGGRVSGEPSFAKTNPRRRRPWAKSGKKDRASQVVGRAARIGVARRNWPIPPGIRVVFVPDGVVVACYPSLGLRVEILQVLERSSQFQFMIERHALSLEEDGEQADEADSEDGGRS